MKVKQHVLSKIHQEAVKNKESEFQNQFVQTFLQTIEISKVRKQEEFNSQLCRMLLNIGDPLNKANHPSFKRFIASWTKMTIPDESTLCKIVNFLFSGLVYCKSF